MLLNFLFIPALRLIYIFRLYIFQTVNLHYFLLVTFKKLMTGIKVQPFDFWHIQHQTND